jgi:hypothetical protein
MYTNAGRCKDREAPHRRTRCRPCAASQMEMTAAAGWSCVVGAASMPSSSSTLRTRPASCPATSQTSSRAATSPTFLPPTEKWFWMTRKEGREIPRPAACMHAPGARRPHKGGIALRCACSTESALALCACAACSAVYRALEVAAVYRAVDVAAAPFFTPVLTARLAWFLGTSPRCLRTFAKFPVPARRMNMSG